MRIIVYLVILALLFLAPVERLDVAKLEPVQTVAISRQNGKIVLETDTEDKGVGTTVEAALQDLEENTSGVIYLDTAQYLLVTEEAEGVVETLRQYLRSGVVVSRWDGAADLQQAARYLSVHAQRTKVD